MAEIKTAPDQLRISLLEKAVDKLIRGQTQIINQAKHIEEMAKTTNKKVASKPRKLTKPTVEINGKKYAFKLARFIGKYGGDWMEITAETVAKDPDKLAAVFKENPSVFDAVE